MSGLTVGQNLPWFRVWDLDNFLIPQAFYFVFDFFVWDRKVDDVVGDFSSFV